MEKNHQVGLAIRIKPLKAAPVLCNKVLDIMALVKGMEFFPTLSNEEAWGLVQDYR